MNDHSRNDTLLGGSIILSQPNHGFKAGSDAVFLAASIPAKKSESLLDVGTGVGSAALCVLAREPNIHITGLEINNQALTYAKKNAELNGFANRFHMISCNIFSPEAPKNSFDHVFSNPPFYHGDHHTASIDTEKALAHVESLGDLNDWVSYCCKRVKSGGTVTFIFPAARTHELIVHMNTHKLGSLHLFPLWPKRGKPAKRIILQGIKGGKAPFYLSPGLIVHNDNGSYTPQAELVLRSAAKIEF